MKVVVIKSPAVLSGFFRVLFGIKREENERIREANLLRDTIHIDVSEKDLEMLDMNIKRSPYLTRNEYIRGIIKELNKDA